MAGKRVLGWALIIIGAIGVLTRLLIEFNLIALLGSTLILVLGWAIISSIRKLEAKGKAKSTKS